jgi:hypothetical protein
MYERKDLRWRGDDLCLRSGRVVASIDRTGPGFRVRMPDGRLSDWANITRITDAAYSLALADLNGGAEQRLAA